MRHFLRDTRQRPQIPVSVTTGACHADAGLREAVEKCVHWTLRRYASRIRDVSVWLVDLNGPRGGVDSMCRIRVRLTGPGTWTVESRADAIHAAVAIAVNRAKKIIDRKLKRRRMMARLARGVRNRGNPRNVDRGWSACIRPVDLPSGPTAETDR